MTQSTTTFDELPPATVPLTGSESIPMVQGGVDVKATPGQLLASASSLTTLVSGPDFSTAGNLATFLDSGGKTLQDSGVPTSSVATLTGAQTLTNKTISGGSNTILGIGNSSLTNSSITIAGHTVSLGGSHALAATDLSNGTTGSGGGIVLASGPTLTDPVVGTQSAADNSSKAASTAYADSVGGSGSNAVKKLDFFSTNNPFPFDITVSKVSGTVLNRVRVSMLAVFTNSNGTSLAPSVSATLKDGDTIIRSQQWSVAVGSGFNNFLHLVFEFKEAGPSAANWTITMSDTEVDGGSHGWSIVSGSAAVTGN